MRDVDTLNTGSNSNLVAAAVAIIEKKNQTHDGVVNANGFNAIDMYGSLSRKTKGKMVADYGKNSTEGVDTVAGKSAFTNLGFSSKNNQRAASSGEPRPPDTNGKQSPAINSQTRSEQPKGTKEVTTDNYTGSVATDDVLELAIHDFDLTAEEVQKFVREADQKVSG